MILNKQVREAGFYYIGHFNCGYLRILFDNCSIKIDFKTKKLFDLMYRIFDLDSEDGMFFEEIKGKYCRLEIDDNYRKIVSIQHIIKDNKIMIEDLEVTNAN